MLPENSSGSSAWIRGLFALAVVALLFGIGLQVEGLWRRHQEQIESQEWPAVTASVVGCFLAPYYPFQKNGGGVVYTVQCRFRYSANGTEYESMVESVGYHHSFPHPNQLPEDALQMEAWAKRHKKGSPQVIHYDPESPQRISLAGADDQISQITSAVALTGAKKAFILSLAFLLLALLARTAAGWQKRTSRA